MLNQEEIKIMTKELTIAENALTKDNINNFREGFRQGFRSAKESNSVFWPEANSKCVKHITTCYCKECNNLT